jgi:hypothetical protein
VEWTFKKYVITKTKTVQMFVSVSLLPLSLFKHGNKYNANGSVSTSYISHFYNPAPTTSVAGQDGICQVTQITELSQL